MAPSSRINHFHSKVVGVTFKNDNGTDRQGIIRQCRPLEALTLNHDEKNPQDENAIEVVRANGQQIGYLSRELAEEIAWKSAASYRFSVLVKNITGGRRRQPLGVNIVIVQGEPGVTDQEVQAYIDTIDFSDAGAVLEYKTRKRNTPQKQKMGLVIPILVVGMTIGGFVFLSIRGKVMPPTVPVEKQSTEPADVLTPEQREQIREQQATRSAQQQIENQAEQRRTALSVGMTLAEVQKVMGYEGKRRAVVGDFESWSFYTADGTQIRCDFNGGELTEWK